MPLISFFFPTDWFPAPLPGYHVHRPCVPTQSKASHQEPQAQREKHVEHPTIGGSKIAYFTAVYNKFVGGQWQWWGNGYTTQF